MTKVDMSEYCTPADVAQIEYEVKKSRFIARAGYAASRKRAMALLDRMRAEFPDARHHCWAYQLGNPNSAVSAAMSDDGEPSGTAGKPILNVLQHKGVGDVMVVVTRYFGGIKLGAGGLVRAYSTATQQVMDCLPVKAHEALAKVNVLCDFGVEQAVRHWLAQNRGGVDVVAYAERVTMAVSLPQDLSHHFVAFVEANGCQVLEP